MFVIPTSGGQPPIGSQAPAAEASPGAQVHVDQFGQTTGVSASASPKPAPGGQLLAPPPQPVAPEGGIVATEAAADAAAFAGPDSPAAYLFAHAPQHLPEGLRYDANQELGWRNFLHQEGIPAVIGKELSRLATQGMLAKPQTEDQQSAGRSAAYAQLQWMWGPDTDSRLSAVNQELDRMEIVKPGLKAYLARTGLANSAWVAATLWNMAKAKGRIK